MARRAEKEFFKPGSPQRDKSAVTASASRAIIDAEAAARIAKTARLRKLRLAVEAGATPPAKDKP